MIRKIAVFGFVFLFAGIQAFAFDLPGFGKKSAAPASGGVSIEKLKQDFADTQNKYYEDVTKHYISSNGSAMEAFGLKQESEKLQAEAKQLESGVTTAKLANLSTVTAANSARVTEKIKSGEKLTAEGNVKFLESMKELGKGLLMQPVYGKGTADIGKAAADAAKKAGPMDAEKFYEVSKGTTKLGELIVTDADTARKTLGVYMDYAKSNQIEVPADVTKAFAAK